VPAPTIAPPTITIGIATRIALLIEVAIEMMLRDMMTPFDCNGATGTLVESCAVADRSILSVHLPFSAENNINSANLAP
jgi:hypothetical protein